MNKQFYQETSQKIKLNTGYASAEKLNMLTQLQALARYDTEIGNYEYCDLCDEIRQIKIDCVYGVCYDDQGNTTKQEYNCSYKEGQRYS